MTFKIIFWDNDGTLVNTEVAFFLATKKVLASVGVDFTKEWNTHECLGKGRSAFELAQAAGLNSEQIQQLRTERNRLYFEELKKNVEILPGVLSTLKALHGSIPMWVVTTSPRAHFDQIMKTTTLGKFFDFTLCGDEVNHVKPHPEPYLTAWKRSGFKKEECLVIEDTERGVIAAKSAGLPCFACPNKLSQTNDFSKADFVLSSITKLIEHI